MREDRGLTVAVLGGGVAGMAAARDLRRGGCRVVVLEREDRAGGMAAGFDAGGVRLDRYYHYFNHGDDEAARTVAEVLGEPIRWRSVPVGMFRGGRSHPFSTPFDLLRFPALGPVDRLRVCAHLARTAAVRDPSALHREPAVDWVRRWLGDAAWEAVWAPLLLRKFGPYAPRVSAAWLWARIRRMAASPRNGWHRTYGFLPGGVHRLADALAARCRDEGIEMRTGAEVTCLAVRDGRVDGVHLRGGDPIEVDEVVSTLALPALARLLDGPLPAGWPPRTDWLPVTVLVLRLRRPLAPYFWLNTNDPLFRTAGVIDTAVLDPMPALDGRHLLYVPFYAATHPVLATGDADALLDWVFDDLVRLSPTLTRADVEARWLFRDAFGQSVCEAGEPPPDGGVTPLANLVAVDASHLHPFDRTLDGSLRLGRRAAARTLRTPGGAP